MFDGVTFDQMIEMIPDLKTHDDVRQTMSDINESAASVGAPWALREVAGPNGEPSVQMHPGLRHLINTDPDVYLRLISSEGEG